MKTKKNKSGRSKTKKIKRSSIKGENPIHIMLNFEEAQSSKKDLLSLQMNVLEARKALKRFNYFRIEEIKLKIKLQKKLNGLNFNLKRLQKVLPKIQVPKILQIKEPKKSSVKEIAKTPEIKEDKKGLEKIKEIKNERVLEDELASIQNQLKSLSQTNNF